MTVAPAFSIAALTLPAGALGIQAVPIQRAVFAAGEGAETGTALDFPAGGEAREVPLPIPFLPGMDEVEIAEAGAAIGPRAIERETDHAAPAGSGTTATLEFAPLAPGAPVTLARVVIEDFRLVASATVRVLHLSGTSRLTWAAGAERPVRSTIGGPAEPIHLMLAPADGPPFLAFPAFPMPGAGGAALYGAALGGAAATAEVATDGKATLTLVPTAAVPPLARLALVVARLPDGARALPNETAPIAWRAARIRAIWRLRPAALKVEAVGAGRSVAVAETPGDPGRDFVAFDAAAALRGLAKAAYGAVSGGDLGLGLRVTATGAGRARLRLDGIGARYLRRAVDRPVRLALRGAAGTIAIAGAGGGLRPVALDLTLDGTFRAERLSDASDDTPAGARQGLAASGARRLARRTALTEAERALPLVRVAVFGRAAAPCEVLVALHAGDAMRVGAPLGPPVTATPDEAPLPAWHRLDLRSPILPPLPPVVWAVLRVPRGRFLWHGPAAEDDTALLSEDDGASWGEAATRPAVQLALADPPARAEPLLLRWSAASASGTISADLAAGQAPGFARRLLLAESRAEDAALLAAFALGPVELAFACRRDADLAVASAVLAYNPWTARP